MRRRIIALHRDEVVGFPLQHHGDAVDHHVEEAADAQADQGQPERMQQEEECAALHGPGQTTWPSLKMGRYIDTTMPPMMVPRITMMIGSIRLDRPATMSSTSDS